MIDKLKVNFQMLTEKLTEDFQVWVKARPEEVVLFRSAAVVVSLLVVLGVIAASI